MTHTDDRKMFAPLRQGQATSPKTKIVAVLTTYEAGATAAGLADEFFRARFAVGTKATLTKRMGELLTELEQSSGVERIPDGRYRVVRTRS
jgi:hypothetical protein